MKKLIKEILKDIFEEKEIQFHDTIHKTCHACGGCGRDFIAGPCDACDGYGFVEKTRKELWKDNFNS